MKNLHKFFLIFSFFLIIFLPFVIGATSGSTYTVGSSVSSLQGGNATGSVYEARTYLTTNTGGEAQGSLYSAIIGFFGKLRNVTSASYSVTINQTAAVQAGNVYSVTIEVITLSGSVEVTLAPKITLYDPLKNLIVSNVDATLLSGKKYQYNFTTSPVHIASEWQTNISIGINSITKQYSVNWNLSNGHTEVRINSVNVASSPTINSNVTITNEDSFAYEYPYEYCIVSVFTQQCGNAGNIDYASGYKLLSAGQSWNPTLSLDVAQQGSYWFKVVVDYGTQSSGAVRSFSVSSIGGGSTQPTTVDIEGNVTVSKQQVVTGVIAQLEEDEQVIINFQPSNADNIEAHTIAMSDVGTNSITIVISSNPITLQLSVGEEKEVDIDSDGENDIYFKLNSITNGKADLMIKQAVAPAGETGGVVGGGATPRVVPPVTGKTIIRPEHMMDVSTRILDEYKIINPGGKVIMEVTLYNLGTEEIKDVIITYCIETTNRTIIKCSEETTAVYTKFQLVKEFLISQDTEDGEYFIKTEVKYNNDTAQSETSFLVSSKTPTGKLEINLSLLLIILLIALAFYLFIKKIALIFGICKRIAKSFSKFFAGISSGIKSYHYKYPKPKPKELPLGRDSILGLNNKKVYTDSGRYIGKVEEVILEQNRIGSLRIKLDKKQKGIKGLIFKYNHVKSVENIIIVDAVVFEHLENL